VLLTNPDLLPNSDQRSNLRDFPNDATEPNLKSRHRRDRPGTRPTLSRSRYAPFAEDRSSPSKQPPRPSARCLRWGSSQGRSALELGFDLVPQYQAFVHFAISAAGLFCLRACWSSIVGTCWSADSA